MFGTQKNNCMALLDVNNLQVSFSSKDEVHVAANDVSFSVNSNAITAIIGESGSGKSVTCYAILGLLPKPAGRLDSGEAKFLERDLLTMSETDLRKIRGSDIGMIFQDPMTCLNPYMRIGKQLMEPLLIHTKTNARIAKSEAIEMLDEVGIKDPSITMDAYPFELSGGMRQRVMIAMALINSPKLLIADEPTTALDVTIQAQILSLIKSLQRKRNIGVLLVSHDLAVVADIADEIVVMQNGRIVESGEPDSIFNDPKHDYTKKLISAIPRGKSEISTQSRETLLEIKNLKTWFYRESNQEPIRAVDDVSLTIDKGEVLGLVGESGSGKSTLGRSILRLTPITGGKVIFGETDLSNLKKSDLKGFRKRMQMIFQDPYASLNPRMTVFDTLAEPLLLHTSVEKQNLSRSVKKLMEDVGLQWAFAKKYPHEFSGGQRQRVAIGRALATRPEFIVADEPVSALDVTIQAQILDLLKALKDEHNLTMLFVSHDLAVVRQIADRVAVLYQGKIVEKGITHEVFERPKEKYTQELIASIPGKLLY